VRIVFAGTPEFALPPLKALLKSTHEICGVYTQPDRPAGRGRKLTPSPVKSLALEAGLPVFQPESLKSEESQDTLRELRPDLMVVVAYGLILPKAVIDIAPLGCINIHASLLPRWRGAAPIQRAILSGDAETGVTIMFIEPRLDAGPMLLKKHCPILQGESSGELHDQLAMLGAEALIETLPALENGTARPETQDELLVTHAAKLSKEEAMLDWAQPASVLVRQVAAFNPWPVAETRFQGLPLRIWRAEALEETTVLAPGSVVKGKDTLDVATGHGLLRLLELQLPGAKRIGARDFLNAQSAPLLRLGDPT
jgi:methionyl-tRNA formyltransferase